MASEMTWISCFQRQRGVEADSRFATKRLPGWIMVGSGVSEVMGAFWATLAGLPVGARVLQRPQSGCLPSPAFQSSGFLADPAEYLQRSRPENSRSPSPSGHSKRIASVSSHRSVCHEAREQWLPDPSSKIPKPHILLRHPFRTEPSEAPAFRCTKRLQPSGRALRYRRNPQWLAGTQLDLSV